MASAAMLSRTEGGGKDALSVNSQNCLKLSTSHPFSVAKNDSGATALNPRVNRKATRSKKRETYVRRNVLDQTVAFPIP